VADPLRRAVAAVAGGPVGAAGAAALDRALPRRPGVLSILTYHRVDDPSARPDLLPSLVSATPAAFKKQVELVARRFDPVSLRDVLDALDDPERLPSRAVLVTFDDGYRDFADNAWPVLRAASVPVTLFVATGFSADPSAPFWWDRLWAAVSRAGDRRSIATPAGTLPVGPESARATMATLRTWLKGLDHDDAMREVDRVVGELGDPAATAPPAVLDWDTLRRLAGEGVTLAPHTRHHPLLDRVPLERAIEEIALAHADLEREIGPLATIPRVLAYPSGAHGGSAVVAARHAGMDLAMTTDRGGNDLRRADRLRLRRINVGGRASVPLVRTQLAWAAGLDARRSAD
jgi:peptidoglycan/xylan/chitin deacetylase (PgdA/CDA1 family)